MAYTDDQRLKMNNDDSVQFIELELIRPNPYHVKLFKVTILLWVSDDLEHLSWRD